MATTGTWVGGTAALYKDVSSTITKFTCLTSANISFSADSIDMTCMDSSTSYATKKRGLKSCTMSGDGNYSQDGSTYGPKDMFDDYDAGTEITVRWSSEVAGDEYYQGTAIITNLEFSGSNVGEGPVTFSVTLDVWDITAGTVS